MKKFVYLCGMMLLSLNIIAQAPLDKNYSPVFSDDFDETGRYWYRFIEYPNKYWRAFCKEYYPAGVTRGTDEHQVYREQNCVFVPAESSIKLIGEYAGHRLQCGEYNVPNYYGYECDVNHGSLYYYSGNIETRKKYCYGYFEIKCKLPFHMGSYPAFWLWGADSTIGNQYYEEIDIMEYSYGTNIGNGTPTKYSVGHLDNPNGTNLIYVSGNLVNLPSNNDITHWHRYGCEWLPNRIIWYLDGNVIFEYCDADSIPTHPMTLKANYSIGNTSLFHPNHPDQYPLWVGSDVMTIDYIKVFQLKWDCSTDEMILYQSDLENFDYKVKKSVTISPANEEIVLNSTDIAYFKVTDSFEINGPFEVRTGGQFSVIVLDCLE